jgi:radical SAM peptide maturase (CXXX-repeat target family)
MLKFNQLFSCGNVFHRCGSNNYNGNKFLRREKVFGIDSEKYSIGKMVESWHSDRAQTVTIVVTDDCNLRCKYCYITHKKSDNKMDIKVAKAFFDRLLTTDEMRYAESLILEFIGGEPMIEAKLIDEIVDYFKLRAFELDHDWYWNYRVSICTNGVNYSSDDVQKLIKKNYNKMSVTITVDGTKEKHDLQRVFPDGSGSFDIINENINLWLKQFGGSTKVTFASDDLPLLYDSILFLWNRGIKEVNANVVFENVWKEEDEIILEEQLKKLADYVISNKLYDKGYHCSFFDETVGFLMMKKIWIGHTAVQAK